MHTLNALVDALERLNKMQHERDEARRALRWYAEPDNYVDRPSPPDTGCPGDGPRVLDDEGERARKALGLKPCPDCGELMGDVCMIIGCGQPIDGEGYEEE